MMEVFPVPLFPGWLERLGFENDDTRYIAWKGSFKIEGKVTKNPGNNWKEFHVAWKVGDITIRWVHELQAVYFEKTGQRLSQVRESKRNFY